MSYPGSATLPGLPYRELALVALVAATTTFLSAGVIRETLGKWFKPHQPRERDMHTSPTPRFGGIAIWLAITLATGLAMAMPALKSNFDYSNSLPCMLIAATTMALTGAIDDAIGLSSLVKLVAQIFTGLILALGGITWDVIYLPGGIYTIDPMFSGFLTIVVTVALVNAANLIDGLDGLLAGISIIAGIGLGTLALVHVNNSYGLTSFYPPAIIAALLVGACLGFLPHNFYPARMFLGDAGSMQLGVLLAALSIQLGGQTGPAVYAGEQNVVVILAPLLVILSVVLVPVLDMALAIIRRIRSGAGLFSADKLHIHHRIVSYGVSHRDAVIFIYLWCMAVTAPALTLTIFPDPVVALATILFGALIVSIAAVLIWRKKGLP